MNTITVSVEYVLLNIAGSGYQPHEMLQPLVNQGLIFSGGISTDGLFYYGSLTGIQEHITKAIQVCSAWGMRQVDNITN